MNSSLILSILLVLILANNQVSSLRDVSNQFLENKTISWGKDHGFIAIFNESVLQTNCRLKIKLPKKISKIILILEINRSQAVKEKVPCGYMKLGMLKFEHGDLSFLEKGNMKYDFVSEYSQLKSEIFSVGNVEKTFWMGWRRFHCFVTKTANITVTGILAYTKIVSNSSCPQKLITVRVKDQNLCISKSVLQDNTILSKLELIGGRIYNFDNGKVEESSNSKWIVMPVILIIFAIAAVIVAVRIYMKFYKGCSKKPSSEPGDRPLIPINSQYRGLCYIIVNKDFKKLPQRHEETRNDVPEIENTFSISLQYRVILKENLTVQKMKKLIGEISSYHCVDDDSLVIFILSHGYGGKIYGTHDKSIMCHLLLKPLYDSDSWIGKPKIIFSVACGGDDHKEKSNCLIYPDNSEFVVSYATSDRNIEEQSPSFYVKSLCDCIREGLDEKTLKMILDEVKESTIEKLNEFGVPFEKHPEYVHHLRQPFMFANNNIFF